MLCRGCLSFSALPNADPFRLLIFMFLCAFLFMTAPAPPITHARISFCFLPKAEPPIHNPFRFPSLIIKQSLLSCLLIYLYPQPFWKKSPLWHFSIADWWDPKKR